MQKDRLYYELEALQHVIESYNACTTTLTNSETHLMKKHLLDMERHILPGLTRISWTALGIKDYIKDITKGIHTYLTFITMDHASIFYRKYNLIYFRLNRSLHY